MTMNVWPVAILGAAVFYLTRLRRNPQLNFFDALQSNRAQPQETEWDAYEREMMRQDRIAQLEEQFGSLRAERHAAQRRKQTDVVAALDSRLDLIERQLDEIAPEKRGTHRRHFQ